MDKSYSDNSNNKELSNKEKKNQRQSKFLESKKIKSHAVEGETFSHVPVLFHETVNAVDNLDDTKIVVDGTLGGGGHSAEIILRFAPKELIGIDQDLSAIDSASKRIAELQNTNFAPPRPKAVFTPVHSNFSNIKNILKNHLGEDGKVDAIIADLGVSSHQIDNAERGFSYMQDAPLDMRMDTSKAMATAYDVVNNWTESRLGEIIREYGEDRWWKKIAGDIVKAREIAPIETTAQLSKICVDAVPGAYFRTGGHPAKRTFQAIRIAVNAELDALEKFIFDAVDCLYRGGRIAVITFHSLEDRIVKQAFKKMATDCLCPPKTPMCICGHRATLDIITRKPILPSSEEIESNSRSGSAKLRVAQRI